MLDILSHMTHEPRGTMSHLMFLSHHKLDAGDAARIFCDTARRLLLEKAQERAQEREPRESRGAAPAAAAPTKAGRTVEIEVEIGGDATATGGAGAPVVADGTRAAEAVVAGEEAAAA